METKAKVYANRCKCCGRPFDSDSPWHDFCSDDHAMRFACNGDKQAYQKWIKDPHNARLVRRGGTPCPPPTYGVWEERRVEMTDFRGRSYIKTVRVNVGGTLKVIDRSTLPDTGRIRFNHGRFAYDTDGTCHDYGLPSERKTGLAFLPSWAWPAD